MIRLKEVTLNFGGLIAINKVSVEIKKQSISALIGPNGAGKTTLFNIISGVYKPVSGEVRYKDQRIDGLKPYQINQRGLARTYQNINLFKDMTALENVMVGNHTKLKASLAASILSLPYQRKEEKWAREKSLEIMDFMGIAKRANQLAKNLSYGEQRLLEISRALASEPDFLLLDEPAAGMNSTEKVDLMKTIERIREKGISILLVEHDMRLVMGITDFIFVLNYGQKIAEGDPKSIQNNPHVIEAYLGGE